MGIYDVALIISPLYMRTNTEQKENGVSDGGVIRANLTSFYVTLWVNSQKRKTKLGSLFIQNGSRGLRT